MQHAPTLEPAANTRLDPALPGYNGVDAPPAQAFDELTKLAARVSETPIALLVLVDSEGHSLKSALGLDPEAIDCNAPMIGYAIRQCQLFVVPDALEDHRFDTDPLVAGRTGARFFAAAPVMSVDGFALGALCVLDRERRDMASETGAMLRSLASQAAVHLELGRTTAALRQSDRRFTSVMEESIEGYISFSADGVIREWNREAERLLGWSRDEIIGTSVVQTVVPSDLWERVVAAFADAPEGPGSQLAPTRVDATALTKAGDELPVEFTFLPLMVSGEHQTNVLLHDISARRRVAISREQLLKTEQEAGVELTSQNEQLREVDVNRKQLLKTEQEAGVELTSQNEQLREVDALKDRFISVVSHELRTPLTAIRGYLEIVLSEEPGPLNEDQKHFLEIVDFSSEALLRVVGDLLLVGKIEAGHLALELAEIDISSLLKACVVAERPVADAKRIGLRLADSAVPPIPGDRGRLSQAFGNIISNAIKFTENGHVDVRLHSEAECAVIDIVDTGAGIPAGEVDHLFVPFFRASTATKEAIPGTGLGLSIAKEIIEAHGGSIGVESEEGQGTAFRIELPTEAPK